MKYRAHGEQELPNLDLFDTMEEAVDLAKKRLTPEALAGNPENIIIEKVRDPELADFFDFHDLMSVMSERMAEKIGNADALTDSNVARMAAHGKDVFKELLNELAIETELRIDGFYVIERSTLENWWIIDRGDADV